METVFGAAKLLLVLAVSMVLIYISGAEKGARYVTEGIRSGTGLCLVFEHVAFSYLGIEAIAVMSYEAKDKAALKNSSQVIAWVTMVFYMILAIALNMCFDWDQQDLIPSFTSDASAESSVLVAAGLLGPSGGSLKKALKGVLVFSAVSAANTTLYISSRMLYGTTFVDRKLNEHRWWHWFTLDTSWGIPWTALVFSGLSFCSWLSFVSLSKTTTAKEVLEFFSFAGSIGVLFVWGTTCLAYLRYYWWLRKFKKEVNDLDDLKRFNRWNRQDSKYFTPTAYFCLQPGLTVLGFMGCFAAVFVLPSATWWGRQPAARELFQVYLIHIVVIVAWIVLKVQERLQKSGEQRKNFHIWNKLDKDQGVFRRALFSFQQLDTDVPQSQMVVVHSPPAVAPQPPLVQTR